MFDLKCKRQGCKFNQNCNCTAKEIDISKGTECITYQDCGEIKKEEDKITQTPKRKTTQVKCNAKCLFNKECHCSANGITVMTNNNKPECCTFLPK